MVTTTHTHTSLSVRVCGSFIVGSAEKLQSGLLSRFLDFVSPNEPRRAGAIHVSAKQPASLRLFLGGRLRHVSLFTGQFRYFYRLCLSLCSVGLLVPLCSPIVYDTH